MISQRRLKVLFIPAWYPSEVNPVAGIFVKEHAKAASLYNDIVVLYAYPDLHPQRMHLYRVSEDTEDGIRTIRVRYSGVFFYLGRKLMRKGQKQNTLSNSQSRSAATLSKLLRIPALMIGGLLYYGGIFATFRKLVKEGWKPDIIHAHVFTAGVPAIILGKLYRIPVVITEHWTVFPRHALTFFERMKARCAMNRARIILPVSDDLRRHIEAYGIKSKFKIVPNVVNTEMFSPAFSQNKKRGSQRKELLLVATLTPQKGVPYLLEALSQIKQEREDFVLNIVGDGPNRREYEELTKNLGLENVVKFHGLKSKEQVAQFMRNCDFYVQPSLWENLPCVFIETMACGKPVIASDVGGVKEIIDKENGILVPPKDVEALREAIVHMLDNYQNYSPEKIAQYARERFSYKVVGKMLDDIYSGALEARAT